MVDDPDARTFEDPHPRNAACTCKASLNAKTERERAEHVQDLWILDMPRAVAGVLVECDPSIKAILVKIDTEYGHDFIIEDIDDEHVLVKGNRHDDLKRLLKEALKDTVREPEESSESD